MLSTRRAFVIQLHTEVDVTAGEIEGRVEHVGSGAAADFDSSDALLCFIRSTVGRLDSQRG